MTTCCPNINWKRRQRTHLINSHDLAEDVLQILPRDFPPTGVLHVVGQTNGGVAQVANGERVHHVETHGTVQLALHHDGVEVAKAKQNALRLAVCLSDGELWEALNI